MSSFLWYKKTRVNNSIINFCLKEGFRAKTATEQAYWRNLGKKLPRYHGVITLDKRCCPMNFEKIRKEATRNEKKYFRVN